MHTVFFFSPIEIYSWITSSYLIESELNTNTYSCVFYPFYFFLRLHAINCVLCTISSACFWNQRNRQNSWWWRKNKQCKITVLDAWASSFVKEFEIRRELETYEKSVWVHASERIIVIVFWTNTHARTQIVHMKINKCLLFDVEFREWYVKIEGKKESETR